MGDHHSFLNIKLRAFCFTKPRLFASYSQFVFRSLVVGIEWTLSTPFLSISSLKSTPERRYKQLGRVCKTLCTDVYIEID